MNQAEPHLSDLPPAVNVSLSTVAGVLWKKSRLLALLFLAGLLTGLLYVHITSPIYEARMAVAANDQQFNIGGNAAASSRGGLGAIIGLAGGDTEVMTPFQHYRFLIESQTMADGLAKTHHVLPLVYPHLWDETTKTWHRPFSVLNPLKDAIKWLLRMPPWHPPTAEDLHQFLDGNMRISSEGIGGVYRVTLRYKDPKVALALLTYINTDTNRMITDADLKKTKAEIILLQRQLAQSLPNETRTALTQTLADHLERQTVLEADLSYSARIIEAPAVSDKPVAPMPLLAVTFGAISFVFLGSLFVLFQWAGGLNRIRRKFRH